VVTFYCTAAIVWIVCCVCVFLLGLSCHLCILQLAAITKQQSASHNLEPFCFSIAPIVNHFGDSSVFVFVV
jgi:hypothetical protein